MSARVALPTLGMTLLLVFGSATAARAGAWTLAPGEYASTFRSGIYSADTYHDPNGDRAFLFGGGEQEQRSLLSFNELGWKKNLSFILGIPVSSVTRRQVSGPALPTATGFADALIGFKYRLANGGTAAALELGWRPPLSYERNLFLTHQDSIRCGDADGDGDSLDANCVRQTGEARLGDGINDVSLALHLGSAITSRGFVQASGGYRYRFEDPDDQVVVTADAGVWITRSLLLAGQYVGEFASTNSERLTDKISRQRAGPTLLLRVDDRLDVFAGSMHTADARNTLHTDEYHVGITFKQTGLHRLQGFLGGVASP